MSATYTTDEVADLLGVSTWTIYESVRQGEPPIPPVRVGRRIVWPRTAIDRLLGLNDEGRPTTGGPTSTTSIPDTLTAPKDQLDAT